MKHKIIFWDVYGTLIKSERGDLASLIRRHDELGAVFEKIVRQFSLSTSAMSLHEAFIAGIQSELEHRRKAGTSHPEVRIEEIWLRLLGGATMDRARDVALFFEREANPKQLQPHAFEVLTTLKQRGIAQGIVSNAQFYTQIELAGLLRNESVCESCTYESLFDPGLVFFSCERRIAKPDSALFDAAAQAALARGIPPAECVVCGDSPVNDIAPARAVGFDAIWYAPGGVAPGEGTSMVVSDLSQLVEIV